jgi:hypothetical protein
VVRTLLLLAAAAAAVHWSAGPVQLAPGPAGTFDETAVKDPSVVRYGDRWHVFYTARGQGRYTLGYVAAKSLEDLAAAPRTQLTRLRGRRENYAAAPQVFYFRPQQRWYLIYQTTDGNYLPVYSTTAAIGRPDSWTAPQPLVEKRDTEKWIDFWAICDRTSAYLFFTRAHREVMVMQAPLSTFPRGFGEPRAVFAPVHEAVHVYRRSGDGRYLMLYEMAESDRRRFGLATAASPEGPWRREDDRFATGAQLEFAPGAAAWTGEVSHGEALRSGYDERLEVPDGALALLIQGITPAAHHGDYPSLRWSLGLIRQPAGR